VGNVTYGHISYNENVEVISTLEKICSAKHINRSEYLRYIVSEGIRNDDTISEYDKWRVAKWGLLRDLDNLTKDCCESGFVDEIVVKFGGICAWVYYMRKNKAPLDQYLPITSKTISVLKIALMLQPTLYPILEAVIRPIRLLADIRAKIFKRGKNKQLKGD